MSNPRRRSSKDWVISFLIAIAFVVAGHWLTTRQQYIFDTISYYKYHPSSEVASFASDTGMNNHGKFLFYASQPDLENAASFKGKCGKSELTTAILGCYQGTSIFIYNVTDPRIESVRDVTAAHEMLHAAYARLSPNDKKKVDVLLEAEYSKLKKDPDLASRMAFYSKTEPGERDNELHSVIGTEVASISPQLETYYKRYFSDRSKVVALNAGYRSVFDSLEAQADALTKQIEDLNSQITSQTDQYTATASSLQSDISTFNTRASSGYFSSQAEFNAARQALLNRVTNIEAYRSGINTLVSQYNQLVNELNGIATQTEDLNHSLNSNLAPAPSL